MPTTKEKPKLRQYDTKIQFDLAEIITAEELERFKASAKEAGAESLTEHFVNRTLREDPAA